MKMFPGSKIKYLVNTVLEEVKLVAVTDFSHSRLLFCCLFFFLSFFIAAGLRRQRTEDDEGERQQSQQYSADSHPPD